MIYAKEKHAPFTYDAHESSLPLFARIDISKNCEVDNFLEHDHENNTPVLFLPTIVHPAHMDKDFLREMTRLYIACAVTLKSRKKIHTLVIAADNDTSLHKIISPRFRPVDIHERIEPFLNLYNELTELDVNVGVILTVEDLSPGGLDPTDGVLIARALQARGLQEIIASSGTRDFPLLFDRRCTKKKSPELEDFNSREPSLASAQWLLQHTDLEVSCCAFIDNYDDAIDLAQKIGLKMLIEKAQIADI